MHPAAYTQRQNAAYARIEAAGAHLAQTAALPDETFQLSAVGHHDANMRALLKLEAVAGLLVRLAAEQGYEETAPSEFEPTEFIVPAENAPPPVEADSSGDEEAVQTRGRRPQRHAAQKGRGK